MNRVEPASGSALKRFALKRFALKRFALKRSLQRLKNSSIFFAVAGVVRLLQWLPHRAAVAIGAWLGILAWLCGGRERRRARSNLSMVYPEMDARERRRMVRRMFVQLGRSALECVVLHRQILPRLVAGSDGPVTFSGHSLQALKAALSEGRGALFITAHLGNWELMAAAVARHAPVSVLFKPSYDPRFTEMIERFRRDNGVEGIKVTRPGHIRQALKALRQGRVLGILIDQPVPAGYMLPFLGHLASTSAVVPTLMRASRAPILVGFIHRTGPCQHAISIQQLSLDMTQIGPEEVTRRLSSEVEGAIMDHPCQWIWSLDRWRSPDSMSLSRGILTQCNLHTSR